jgi:hypothetical protein
MNLGRFPAELAWGSALLAGVLSFASPKESSQRKGDPKVGALRVPCATRQAGRLAKLACGSNNASRLPPASLRCSAPLMGTRKASAFNQNDLNWHSYGQPGKKPKNEIDARFRTDASLLPLTRGRPGGGWFPGPLEGAEQRRVWRKRGEDCLRAKPEFRSPRQPRVAQGTRAAGTDPGSPFLCLLSFGEAKESETPRKGGTPRQMGGTPCQSARIPVLEKHQTGAPA